MTQQFLFIDELLDTAYLGCGHDVSFDLSKQPLRADGWYTALFCPSCRRQREIQRVAYRKRREP